jgi:UDPglucose 6-dehydrogenase
VAVRMNITVFGTGYVGLVAAACFADLGNHVVCVDIDSEKIAKLKQGIIPIYEPGLSDIVQRCIETNHIQFTTDSALGANHGECLFIAVGTPPGKEGLPDMQYIYAVANTIAENISEYKVIVQKSTAPVGTVETIKNIITKKCPDAQFDVVSNPEFLKEGAAIRDFLEPDRVVIGLNNPNAKAKNILEKLYQPICEGKNNLIWMDSASSELTKYAANGFLAMKISFMNELANLAEKVGADVQHIKRGIGSDVRIGPHFIQPGCGFGGFCFGKDIDALIGTAKQHDYNLTILSAVQGANQKQKQVLFQKIQKHFNQNLQNKVISVWGLAFKPNTDDMRDAPSIVLINALLEQGARIQAHDPEAIESARIIFKNNPNILFCETPEQALEGADALVIVTEWNVYKNPDFSQMKRALKQPVIFDGRNIYEPETMKQEGISYFGIGRKD